MKLVIGNRAYSSWSMRGWLALKLSGLDFEELVVPMFDDQWDERREGGEFAPGGGKVPLLWNDDIVVWDSLAIIEYCAEKAPDAGFWPTGEAARAMARSMAAEMHSGFTSIRRELPMNVRRSYPPADLDADVRGEIDRVMQVWAQARARFGGTGDYLFGAWSAADIMFAPVVTRFVTYGVPVPPFAGAYMKAVLRHPHVAQWIDLAQDEPWVIEAYEQDGAAQ